MLTSMRHIPPWIQGAMLLFAAAPVLVDTLLLRNIESVWFLHLGLVFLVTYYRGLRAGLIVSGGSILVHLVWRGLDPIVPTPVFHYPWFLLYHIFLFAALAVSIALLTTRMTEKHRELEDIFNSLDASIWSHDMKQDKIIISTGIELIYGYTGKQFAEDPSLWDRVVHPDDAEIAREMNRRALAGERTNTEFRIIRPDGEVRWVQDKAAPIFDKEHRLIRINGVVFDITERKLAEEKITKLAYYDYLTHLPNRKNIHEQLHEVLGEPHVPIAVFFLDLDGFKEVNDTLGHEAGDQLLQQASQRMKDQLRPQDHLGRLGGDEFLAVILDADRVVLAHLAERMIHAISQPYTLWGPDIGVTVSIGISRFPEDGRSSEELMKHADQAMYVAKATGKNRYHFYEDIAR